jgi:hypothetical protein
MNTNDMLLKLTEGRPFMRQDELASLMGVTLDSLRNKLYAKRLPLVTFKLGGKMVVHVTDVAEYIDGQREAAATDLLRSQRRAA